MDPEERRRKRGSARYDSRFAVAQPAVERRASKKSSSQDRHGKVYPDSFGERTIRTVAPDAALESPPGLSAMETSYISSATNSPRSAPGASPYERSQENLSSAESPESTDGGRGAWHNSRRARTRTLDEQRRETSPSSFMTRTRQRIGSVHAGQVGGARIAEDTIGFPSIAEVPSRSGTTSPRGRLQKHPQRALSPLAGFPARNGNPVASPTLTSDASKILQLMKTTCGRMHGILSFRSAVKGNWTTGYCAINVATGSLIYQARGGELNAAKTLIPDLRGCQVRTQYDPEVQYTCLNVSTHSSGLGIQLRPHVPETFDSWLAALLCWQPIRPKGVQNKMTKPQAIWMPERRVGERRRNSEHNPTKQTTIIKVGKLMLWGRSSSSSGLSTPVASRRVSTYRQQKAISPWHKVSCTLQDNGFFQIFSESEVTHIATIHLSRLSRCAIQQLDPSVLEDEFTIAIYPQYTSSSESQAIPKPLYLSLDSRVLFEVWFVLLRAFTVPDLYGPALSSTNLDPQNGGGDTAGDMFRVERVLAVRITEAKLFPPNGLGQDSRNLQKAARNQRPIENPLLGDYYSELLLDGDVRAKTAIKTDTVNPFWREEFEFVDLPPVLSSASVLLKTRNSAQKDWVLKAASDYALDQGEVDPESTLGDIEVSSHDSTFGKVELRLDDLERGIEVDKWWPILDASDQVIGEMLMKVRLEELIVLMSKEYQPMSELLHNFSNSLTVQMAAINPAELKRLSETLLNIFQVSGRAADWLMALVEDEIDGLHKETAANRLRYSSRIHSNESHESSDRELVVQALSRSAVAESNLLFRGNSLLTKALDQHMRRLGKEYLEDTLGASMRDIDESDPECEVDPNRISNPEVINRNWRNLQALTKSVWKCIFASAPRCPSEIRVICRHIKSCAEDRYGDYLRTVPYSSVSGFLFLRFFCPAILNPKLFGLLKGTSTSNVGEAVFS